MGKKRQAFVHIGMPGVGDVLGPAIAHHRGALAELGINAPAKHAREAFRAAVEITRSHRTWGLRRRHVEGTWADIYRRAAKGRDTVVVSAPLLATATPEQIDLFVDGLTGFEVHVVVTASAPHAWTVLGEPETDLALVLERWERAVRSPERIHVIAADGDPGRAEEVQAEVWRRFGRIAGFGTASLGLADVPPPVAARAPWAITSAPMARAGLLAAISDTWREQLAAKPYDVVGDPGTALAPRVEEPSAREAELDRALAAAIGEIERLTRHHEALAAELATTPRRFRGLRPVA